MKRLKKQTSETLLGLQDPFLQDREGNLTVIVHISDILKVTLRT